jgi:hypothetical protein
MGAATSSNTNLLEGGVIVMGVAMLLREILPPIVKIAKKDDSNKESPIQSNGYLKKTEFEKLAEKVQYKDTCVEIVKRFDSYNNEQKERMEEQKQQITDLSKKVEIGFNELQKTIKNGNNY